MQPPAHGSQAGPLRRRSGVLRWILLAAGLAGALSAAALDARAAGAAASQDWPPFVLVAGLLLVGVVAHEEGLFSAIGHRLACLAPGALFLYAGGCVAVAVVTALLNLDTSVAFLTPVLIHAARRRGVATGPLLYGSLLLANAGSLVLPGSNLTNLIVLGHLHLSGLQFLGRMWPSGLAAVVITALVLGVAVRRDLRGATKRDREHQPVVWGLGALAVGGATVVVLALRTPALPILGIGAVAVVIAAARRRFALREAVVALDLPVLAGLFGVAVSLGALGRVWSEPAALSGHVGIWGTAVVAAGASVLVNNLPAASLLGSHVPAHPLALLAGLNLGPNLFATGSLAWVLWLKAARATGETPSIAKASRLGLATAPPALAAAVGLLVLLRR